MKKSTKCLIAVLTLLFVIISTCNVVFAKSITIPSATSDFYVNDFACVFSEEQKSRIMENAVKLSDENDGVQVVITTVKSLDNIPIEDYSYEMYNQYGIGKNDMGILILLSTGDRQIRVEVGKAMEAYINDSKAGRFTDKYAIPSLKEDKFDEGLIKLQEALISEIKISVEKDTSDSETVSKPIVKISKDTIISIVIVVLITILVAILASFIVKRKKSYRDTIDNLHNQIEERDSLIKSIESKNEELNERLRSKNKKIEILNSNLESANEQKSSLMIWKEKASKVYPDVQERIIQLEREEKLKADKLAAGEVDNLIRDVDSISASRESSTISKLSTVISAYENLSVDQKKFVKGDINKIENIYQKSRQLRQQYDKEQKEKRCRNAAEDAKEAILAIIAGVTIARASDYRNLKRAVSIYNDLDSNSKSYFDKSVHDKLQKLFEEAKRAKRREEEEEEEQRRRSRIDDDDYGNSSFGGFGGSFGGSGSSFGGFGGSSGGGGASRGF